jgi:hypothetical protein
MSLSKRTLLPAKKPLLALGSLSIVVTLLSGCGVKSEIKDAVKARLNDPGSAQFEDIVVSESETRACAVWNAKNRLGGYGGWKIAELEKRGDSWIVSTMKGLAINCGEKNFRARDAAHVARIEAKREIVELFQKKYDLNFIDALNFVQEHCRGELLNYSLAVGSMARTKALGNEYSLSSRGKLAEARRKLVSGQCVEESKRGG